MDLGKTNNPMYWDSIKMISKTARIEFHHPVKKASLIAKEIQTQEGIDSLFNFVGELSSDTTCINNMAYNHFGQIDFFTDSTHKHRVAKMHFVLEGNCVGLYLETDNSLARYNIKPQGNAFLTQLYNLHKSWLGMLPEFNLNNADN